MCFWETPRIRPGNTWSTNKLFGWTGGRSENLSWLLLVLSSIRDVCWRVSLVCTNCQYPNHLQKPTSLCEDICPSGTARYLVAFLAKLSVCLLCFAAISFQALLEKGRCPTWFHVFQSIETTMAIPGKAVKGHRVGVQQPSITVYDVDFYWVPLGVTLDYEH